MIHQKWNFLIFFNQHESIVSLLKNKHISVNKFPIANKKLSDFKPSCGAEVVY